MIRHSFWTPLAVSLVLAGGLLCGGLAQLRADDTQTATVQAGQLPGGSPATMKTGMNCAFVLQGGTLIKYGADAKQMAALTLAEKPAQPTQAQTQGQPPMGPPSRGEMLIAGDAVLVILGDSFFNVNGTTMTITAKGTLPALERPQPPQGQGGQGGQQGMRWQGPGGPRGQGMQDGPQGGPGGQAMQGGPQDGPGGQGMQGGRGQDGPGGQGMHGGRGPGGPDGQGMRGQGGPGGQGQSQGQCSGQGPMDPGGPGGMMGGPGMPPPPPLQLELSNRTLFVLRGPQLLAINIDTGAVSASGTGTQVSLN